MSSRILFCGDRNVELHKLFCRILPVNHWVIKLQRLPCRVVLCDFGIDNSNGFLQCRLISGIDGIHNLHDVSWRILLRHNGSHCCDGELLFWIILCCVCNSVLNLPCWLLPSNYRLFKLLSMSWRVVLCHRGPDSSDRCVRSRVILGRFFNCVFKLSLGNIFVCIFNELLELSCGLVSGIDRINILYGMR